MDATNLRRLLCNGVVAGIPTHTDAILPVAVGAMKRNILWQNKMTQSRVPTHRF